ncbi:sigma-54-dependent Fis family transcriptional regulator [Rhodobacteraceae bacterium NNCM2]|nr:sigma-54-dependent Fis family transcriptional regulator [Coraliihabitans acroporae]
MLSGRYIVLIEDDSIMGNSLAQRLELEGATVKWVRQSVLGVAAVRTPRQPVDAVVCDIRLPDGTGEEIFNTVSRSITPPPFLFITGQGEIDQAVRLLRAGAADYLTKPFEMTAFLSRLACVLRPEPSDEIPAQTGISPLARQVDALVADYARHDRPVLIRGQRGLGKASIGRRIHDLSDRRAASFIKLNPLRDEVDEGRLDEALEAVADGSLFVTGIGRLTLACQKRLIDAVGRQDFRLIASCGTRIHEKIDDGGFRADLFYALVANEIVVPPLSQRSEDAVWLAGQLYQSLNAKRRIRCEGISDLALSSIREHDWPGNGQELRARLVRAMDAAEGGWLFPADLFPEVNEETRDMETLSEAREAAERRQIIRAIDRTGGQIAEAARLLRVSRTTLWEKMQKLGL